MGEGIEDAVSEEMQIRGVNGVGRKHYASYKHTTSVHVHISTVSVSLESVHYLRFEEFTPERHARLEVPHAHYQGQQSRPGTQPTFATSHVQIGRTFAIDATMTEAAAVSSVAASVETATTTPSAAPRERSMTWWHEARGTKARIAANNVASIPIAAPIACSCPPHPGKRGVAIRARSKSSG